MDIVIIGTGNVAAVLGRKFREGGHHIIQIYGRNASGASGLAYEWDTESTNYKSLISPHADLYLVAVPDDAIGDVIRDLHFPGKVVAHTAASVPMEVLKPVSQHVGVIYPLQSLRKEMSYLPEIPVFFEGNDDRSRKILGELAGSISGQAVGTANGDERLKLHVAAVVVSNFTNHLYALAEEYCRKESVDFRQLIPLIEETAKRVREVSPANTQTGPAVRHDADTIKKHLELLNAHPRLKELYAAITRSIQG
jgi:predicted short-subunit dehydrogenase-like oxidoreductase (DUF2520 family)